MIFSYYYLYRIRMTKSEFSVLSCMQSSVESATGLEPGSLHLSELSSRNDAWLAVISLADKGNFKVWYRQ